jgi:hypothetical protein
MTSMYQYLKLCNMFLISKAKREFAECSCYTLKAFSTTHLIFLIYFRLIQIHCVMPGTAPSVPLKAIDRISSIGVEATTVPVLARESFIEDAVYRLLVAEWCVEGFEVWFRRLQHPARGGRIRGS